MVLPFVRYCLPSITTVYFLAADTVTSGFRSAANIAAVIIIPKARVKIFFILLRFNCFVLQTNREELLDIFFKIPIAFYWSKQMPPCQERKKETLSPLLFMVNENF
jgi:hypothetical protein